MAKKLRRKRWKGADGPLLGGHDCALDEGTRILNHGLSQLLVEIVGFHAPHIARKVEAEVPSKGWKIFLRGDFEFGSLMSKCVM